MALSVHDSFQEEFADHTDCRVGSSPIWRQHWRLMSRTEKWNLADIDLSAFKEISNFFADFIHSFIHSFIHCLFIKIVWCWHNLSLNSTETANHERRSCFKCGLANPNLRNRFFLYGRFPETTLCHHLDFRLYYLLTNGIRLCRELTSLALSIMTNRSRPVPVEPNRQTKQSSSQHARRIPFRISCPCFQKPGGNRDGKIENQFLNRVCVFTYFGFHVQYSDARSFLKSNTKRAKARDVAIE